MSKVAFFVGSGAVAGAWDPVFRGVRAALKQESIGLTASICNQYFAAIVSTLRSAFQISGPNANLDHLNADSLTQLKILKQKVARELRETQLGVTPDFENALREKSDQVFAVVTTNWDSSVAKCVRALGEIEVVHLHGEASRPATLYLPSETVLEPYRLGTEGQYLANAHARTIDILRDAEEIVIFGLSFSPLDGELCAVAMVLFDQAMRIERITVIDKNPEPIVGFLRFRKAMTNSRIEILSRTIG